MRDYPRLVRKPAVAWAECGEGIVCRKYVALFLAHENTVEALACSLVRVNFGLQERRNQGQGDYLAVLVVNACPAADAVVLEEVDALYVLLRRECLEPRAVGLENECQLLFAKLVE